MYRKSIGSTRLTGKKRFTNLLPPCRILERHKQSGVSQKLPRDTQKLSRSSRTLPREPQKLPRDSQTLPTDSQKLPKAS